MNEEESFIKLSEDGGILKKILKEGSGETPPNGAKVQVHYVGKLENGTVFDSSRERNDYFHFTLGKGTVIKGWDVGVASMKKGELALLICKPEYAYGSEGSPPSIPPNSTLHFEVELFGWDDPEPDTIQEKLKAGEILKIKGNELYKVKDFKGALEKYNKALEYFAHCWGLEEEEKKQVDALKLSLLLNVSACQMELGDYTEVYYTCSKVLDIDTNNVKALYRRGKSLSIRNEFEKAKEDLVEAAKLAPNNKEIRQEYEALKNKIGLWKQKEKELFSGIFKAQATN